MSILPLQAGAAARVTDGDVGNLLGFGIGGHADFVLDMSGVGAMLTGMRS